MWGGVCLGLNNWRYELPGVTAVLYTMDFGLLQKADFIKSLEQFATSEGCCWSVPLAHVSFNLIKV